MTFKKHLFSITILLALLGGSVCVLTPLNYINAQCVPGPADADGDGDDCDYSLGENMFNCPADCPIPAGIPHKPITGAGGVLEDAVSWILGIALAISIVMLIYGGLYYVTSSGDMEKATTSKKIIKYALLGVAITGVSYVIVQLLDTIIG